MRVLVVLLQVIIFFSSLTTQTAIALPRDLVFYPDSGIRLTDASVPNISYDASSKTYYLFYSGEGSQRGSLYATSTDGLNFTKQGQQISYAFDPRRVRLPDGNYRLYQYDMAAHTFGSQFATDGINFSTEAGVRYALDASDNASAGIYDVFSARDGRMVMLYLGDLMGLNNLRRAVSSDNGVTFSFDSGNVLGDSSAGGGSRSFVDTRSIRIRGGCRRLFAMKGGREIFSFLTSNSGFTLRQERGVRLALTQLSTYSPTGMFDPAVVLMPNGRYRMYVTLNSATENGLSSYIISATTKRPSKSHKLTRCHRSG